MTTVSSKQIKFALLLDTLHNIPLTRAENLLGVPSKDIADAFVDWARELK